MRVSSPTPGPKDNPSRLDEAEDQISNLENKVEKNIQSKQQKERKNPKKLRIA